MIHGDTLTIDAFGISNHFFPSEEDKSSQIGKIFHDYYSGNASHLGWLDLVQLRTIIKKHAIKHITLTNLDVLGKIAEKTKEIKICNAYLYDGRVIIQLPKKVNLRDCHPIYDVKFGGWSFTANSCMLPHRAESYMQYLLMHTKVETVSFSTNKVKVTAYRTVKGYPELRIEKI